MLGTPPARSPHVHLLDAVVDAKTGKAEPAETPDLRRGRHAVEQVHGEDDHPRVRHHTEPGEAVANVQPDADPGAGHRGRASHEGEDLVPVDLELEEVDEQRHERRGCKRGTEHDHEAVLRGGRERTGKA